MIKHCLVGKVIVLVYWIIRSSSVLIFHHHNADNKTSSQFSDTVMTGLVYTDIMIHQIT